MNELLYRIPAKLLKRYQAGEIGLYGAVLKELSTGSIVGHVQQTGAAETLLRSLLNIGPAALSPANFIATAVTGGVTIFQNEQIKSGIAELQSSVALLENLQVAGMLLSGVGIGISVAGFAVMNARLKSIAASIDRLDHSIGAVTSDRRGDELKSILQRIENHLETVDGLERRKEARGPAERASEGLRAEAGQLYVVLDREIAMAGAQIDTVPNLNRILGLTSMIRLAHEASTRALFLIEEVDEAGRLAEKQGIRLMEHTATLSPDALARLAAMGATSAVEAGEARRAALPRARLVVADVRQTALMIASQADLARLMIDKGISGRTYIAATAEHSNEPLLMLPA